jgi:hypothetical protein
MTTDMISHPACAHLASVAATLKSWSSGCAWMLIARLGMYSVLVMNVILLESEHPKQRLRVLKYLQGVIVSTKYPARRFRYR